MVKLTKIYTKTGDAGTTGLGTGARVSKASLRVEAYGTVDEANAAVGVAVVQARAGAGTDSPEIAAILAEVQHDLFDVGADLCTPVTPGEADGSRLRVTPAQTARLERLIDRHNEHLAPLNSFVLPGGTALAASLHVARTIVRRAERLTVALAEAEPQETGEEAIRYLNRLSDLLFVLSRVANDRGAGDVLWLPGKHRSGD
jgi:cob(I)alamin adenosyltransferase